MEGPMPYVDCFGEPPLLDDKEEVAQAKELWEEVIVDSKNSTDDDVDDDCLSDTSSITSEDLAAYNKQAFESGGFDVDSYPGYVFRMITPSYCSEDKLSEQYSGHAEFAIKEYNKRKHKNLKVTGSFNYYITFAAVDEKAFDDEPKVFQALVARGPKYYIVKLCRQKGDPSEGYSRVAEAGSEDNAGRRCAKV